MFYIIWNMLFIFSVELPIRANLVKCELFGVFFCENTNFLHLKVFQITGIPSILIIVVSVSRLLRQCEILIVKNNFEINVYYLK